MCKEYIAADKKKKKKKERKGTRLNYSNQIK